MGMSTIEETIKSVESMKAELDQASIHLENALFLKNKLKLQCTNTEDLIKQTIERHDPPLLGKERR